MWTTIKASYHVLLSIILVALCFAIFFMLELFSDQAEIMKRHDEQIRKLEQNIRFQDRSQLI